jgi:hypothetical protein
MPVLLLFVPCQKAIQADDNSVSAVNILDTIKVGPVPPNTIRLDKGSAIPFSLNILTVWCGTAKMLGRLSTALRIAG